MNKVFNEDFFKFQGEIEYDYVYTGTPCLNDFKNFGVDLKNPESYKIALVEIFKRLKPKLGTITIGVTDRRMNSKVIPKHMYIYEVLKEFGYEVKDIKYAVRSLKYNAYRHQAIPLVTYQHVDKKGLYNLKKDSLYSTYGPDCWLPEGKEEVLQLEHKSENLDNRDTELVSQPINFSTNCIANFTDVGHTVFDPFMGSWTTAIAAHRLKRNFVGFEINNTIYEYGKNRYEKEVEFF